jgi:hypothetical protein
MLTVAFMWARDAAETVLCDLQTAQASLLHEQKMAALGSCGLLLRGFAQILGAVAQLLQKTGVLDGDDRLSCEIADQLDLPVGERTHLLAIDRDRADQVVPFEHGRDENRAHQLC